MVSSVCVTGRKVSILLLSVAVTYLGARATVAACVESGDTTFVCHAFGIFLVEFNVCAYCGPYNKG